MTEDRFSVVLAYVMIAFYVGVCIAAAIDINKRCRVYDGPVIRGEAGTMMEVGKQ